MAITRLPSERLLISGTDHETRKLAHAAREKDPIGLEPELRLTRPVGGDTTLREGDIGDDLIEINRAGMV